ncbi:MAG: FAD-dependent oxidoreductase [Elusimicrobiota bacterium]
MGPKTVIIGAGLAGLSAAYHLKDDWVILEKNATLGGLASSERVGGFIFDKTGHLLHLHSPYAKDLILERLLKGKLEAHRRNSWIYSKATMTRYPFQANTFGLPESVIAECVSEFLKARERTRKPKDDPDFHRWSIETFGKGISRHFMLPYNKKLWRHDLRSMTTEWIRGFVPVPSKEEVLYGALTDQKRHFGYNSSFYYPRSGGIQALPDAFDNALDRNDIFSNEPVISIDVPGKKVITRNGIYPYDRLINTAPLNVMVDWVRPYLTERLATAAARALTWTVVYNLNLGVRGKDTSGRHWTYFPENRYPFYRIGIGSNFAPASAPMGTRSYYIEYAKRPGERFDYEKMRALTIAHMRDFGWMRRKDEIMTIHWNRIDPGYVVFTKERREFLPAFVAWLERHGITSTGRYGAWKYSFMEEAILDGKAAAEATHKHDVRA